MIDWELDVTQLNRRSHGDAAVPSEAPSSRVWDLGDQSVGVTSIEDAGYLGALAPRIGDVLEVRRIFELLPDVGRV